MRHLTPDRPEPTHKDVGLDNVLHTRAVGLEDLGEVVDALVLFGCQPPPIFRRQLIRGGERRGSGKKSGYLSVRAHSSGNGASDAKHDSRLPRRHRRRSAR